YCNYMQERFPSRAEPLHPSTSGPDAASGRFCQDAGGSRFGRRSTVGEFVRLETDGSVATIRLDRPPMNAIDGDLLRDLQEASTHAATNPDIRAVVLYGGEKLFAAGADIKMMAGLPPADIRP